MKFILGFFLAFFSIVLYAQDYSTLNIISPNFGITILINKQQVGSLGPKEALQCKVYSEGRLEITIIGPSNNSVRGIDVLKGNTYYFVVPPSELVPEEKGKKYLAKSKIVSGEEDIENPFIVSKNKYGPKQGTCFLISKQGYLLTNYHVISDAKSIQIKGIGNDFSTIYGAEVVAFDIDLDLALLKLKNQNINFDIIPYKISLETNPQGAKSFVLGYPLTTAMGEEIKVTEGLISSKTGYKGTISQYQFSAAIQPGNSGSPLFNEKGDIIGIINAKLQGAEGAGYAIKSQYLLTFLKLVDNIQIENDSNTISDLNLTGKISKLKNYIFIVKTE